MLTPRPLLAVLAATSLTFTPSLAQDMAYKLGADASSFADFGRSVADAGDINSDGVPDILVGAPFHDDGGGIGGAVFIYSGRTGALLWSRNSEFDGDAFGWSVDGIGDITGDGRPEILVSAPLFDNNGLGASNAGKVYVFSPATNTLLISHGSAAVNSQIGQVVRGLGDITGDGIPDYAYGVPNWDNGLFLKTGAVFAYSGSTMSSMWTQFGTQPGEGFGFSMDVIRNGGSAAASRIGVGSPRYDVGTGADIGRLSILNGSGNVISTINGSGTGSWFGYAVAGLGDVDNDGFHDFVTSMPYRTVFGVGSQAGIIVAYSGQNQISMWELTGSHATANLGQAIARVGDTNGDGTPDVLIGSPNEEPGGISDQGEAMVVSGLNGQVLATYAGGINDEMGRSVSSVGDLNGDGNDDYVIGANEAPFGSGEAYVHLCEAPEPVVYCNAKVNSQGCLPEISADGVPSLSVANNFFLSATNVVNQKPGLLLWGRVAASTPFQGGTLCVGAPIVRTTVQSSAGNLAGSDCSGSYSYHFNQAYMNNQSIVAGDTIYSQYWSRDPASSFGVGLTDAVEFTVVP